MFIYKHHCPVPMAGMALLVFSGLRPVRVHALPGVPWGASLYRHSAARLTRGVQIACAQIQCFYLVMYRVLSRV